MSRDIKLENTLLVLQPDKKPLLKARVLCAVLCAVLCVGWGCWRGGGGRCGRGGGRDPGRVLHLKTSVRCNPSI